MCAARCSSQFRWLLSWVLLSAGVCPGWTADDGVVTKLTCLKQLRLLSEGLAAYRASHDGVFPADLGALFPDFVSDPQVLRCPEAVKKGIPGPRIQGFLDPSASDNRVIGYTWEMPERNPAFWEGLGLGMTFRRFKELQHQSLVGDQVPIIRCSHHGEHQVLNLTVNGRIYESGNYWEGNFVTTLPGPRLAPELVEMANRPMRELVRPRSIGLTPDQLDLRAHYNARFEDPWTMAESEIAQYELTDFPDRLGRGPLVSRGVSFDAVGIIQLNGRLHPRGGWFGFDRPMYPEAAPPIPVNQRFRYLHVLGAVLFEDPPGTVICTVDVRRSGHSEKSTWNWRYGEDVLTYRFLPERGEPALETSPTALVGRFLREPEGGHRPRLFHLRWENPLPELEVTELNIRAGEGVSSPFMVAITLEGAASR